MFEVPSSDFTEEQRIDFYSNALLPDLIKNVCSHIFKGHLTNTFFNFSDFFLKQRMDDDDVKKVLKDKIIVLLQEKNYKLAYAFNKTGLIITKTQDDMDKSVWKSNLDFNQI